MIQKRGYVVNHAVESETLDSFIETFGAEPDYEKLQVDGIRVDDLSDKISIFFVNDPHVGITNLKPIVDKMQENSIHTGIIIIKNKISSFARQAIVRFEPLFHLELFMETELLVDITAHFMVPEHIAISEYEKKELLKKLAIHEEQLPLLKLDDPISKYYGFKRGQVYIYNIYYYYYYYYYIGY
ncbi:hypothetical protein WA158_000351 [Blastocystis sp. Blastoise]